MRVGVPKEIKTHEYRVGLSPSSVRELVHHGHEVLVETGAGSAIGLDDDQYQAVGARIAADAAEVFAWAQMVVKVKEPQEAEYGLLRPDQILFTYLHLAPDAGQTHALVESGAICIAYETVKDPAGRLPLLAPMSQVAGRMAAHVGATHLERARGGRGVLLGGVPGVPGGKVVVIGGGVVGINAAVMAMGLQADVTVIDKSLPRLGEIDTDYEGRIRTRYSTLDAIEAEVTAADLVVGAVLVPGAAAPKLVTREMVRAMQRGSVMVDVAIDQGGCFETSRPTTHADPTYVVDDVVHYCVTNMPGAVARTSTLALNNATLPYVLALAGKGVRRALHDDRFFLAGLNVHSGRVTFRDVAQAHGLPFVPAEEALGL